MPHLFLVEDQPTDLELIAHALQRCRAPIFVHKFQSGQEAIQFLKHQPTLFDIAIVDLHLPDLSGIEVIETLRKVPAGRFAQILAISGAEDPESRAAAMASGANAFLVKNWDATQFQQELTRAVEHFLV